MPRTFSFDMRRDLSIYARFIRPYRWLALGTLLVVLLGEALSAADKYVLKLVVDKATAASKGLLSTSALSKALVVLALSYFVVVGSRALANWFFIHLINRMEVKVILDVKRHFFHHIVNLSHRFHVSSRTGALISRLTRGGSAIERLTDAIYFNFAPLLFQLVIVGGSLLYFNAESAVVVFVMMAIFIAYSLVIQQLQRKANVEANAAEDHEKGTVADLLTNIESIKYFGKEQLINERYARVTGRSRDAAKRHWDYYRWASAGQILIVGLGSLALLFVTITAFVAGDITIGTLVFIYTIYGNIVFPLYSFVRGVRDLYRSLADIDPLFSYGDVEPEIKDAPGAKRLRITRGDVLFDDISFRYDRRSIFKGFSLHVPAGRKVALVGHSGCGKTTLVKLLYRLYDVNEGRMVIDDQDVRDVTQESLRNAMSIVPQECVLFDDTIYNNIAFSRPGARRKDVLAAIKAARLDSIIASFPDKEHTIVGERGVKLSGGEKQRVSIARAILADKKVLVLDEATSSLDSQTEHDIQLALERLMRARTTIIIAHRLSTIMAADLIVVMKKGRIVQSGTHEELLRQGGEYRKLWDLQKGGYIA